MHSSQYLHTLKFSHVIDMVVKYETNAHENSLCMVRDRYSRDVLGTYFTPLADTVSMCYHASHAFKEEGTECYKIYRTT